MLPNTVVGTFVGTGAPINVAIGFNPDFMLVTNVTDGDTVQTAFRGLNAAGAATEIGGVGAANADNALDLTYEGPTGQGFTAGTDLSELGKVYGYLAIRTGPGAG